jgi:hypothetical protein
MMGWWRRVAAEERNTTLLGLVRVAFGCLLLKDALRGVTALRDQGYFADYFFIPLIDRAWVPSELGYSLLLGLKIAGACCAIAGLVPRGGLLLAASIGLYVLACDRLQYHNNRYATHLLAFLFAFAPCDRSFRLPWLRGRGGTPVGPFWAVRLVQLQMSLIYLASGGAKLLDDDWRGGQVMLLRFARAAEIIVARDLPLPRFFVDLLDVPVFASLASKAAIGTELFLAIGLLQPKTRIPALWLGTMFHLGIHVSASVDLFSYLMLSGYILFATPELRERTLMFDPRQRLGRLCARILPWLDWLQRFRITPGEPGMGFEIRDRDGRCLRGRAALIGLCRTLPLLFPLWLPLALTHLIAARLFEGHALAASATHDTR